MKCFIMTILLVALYAVDAIADNTKQTTYKTFGSPEISDSRFKSTIITDQYSSTEYDILSNASGNAWSMEEYSNKSSFFWNLVDIVNYKFLGVLACGLILMWFALWIDRIAQNQREHAEHIDNLSSAVGKINVSPVKIKDESTLQLSKPSSNKSLYQIPRIEFVSGVIHQIVDGINSFRNHHRGLETGYALVGTIIGSGQDRKIIVKGLVGAGADVGRSEGHIEFDRDYQQVEIDRMRLIDWNLSHIGDAHLHPGPLDHCSSGDYQTDKKNVMECKSQEMVFVIATNEREHYHRASEKSICIKGLRLNFFYMGKESRYEYQQFLPDIVEEDTLAINESLRMFYDSDPTRVILDFDCLRRLTAFEHRFLEYPMKDGVTSPCVQLTHRKLGYKMLVFFGDSAFEKPQVYIEIREKVMEYECEYIQSTPAECIWLTQIALLVEKDMESLISQKNKQQLEPAEVKPTSAITA